jgi:DHA2 family multidrug resistance protein
MGYTATMAGLVMAPVGLLAIVLSPIVGLTVSRVDPRWYASFAFAVFAVVMWMRSQFTVQTDFETILVPTLVQGIAMAFFFVPLVTITLSGLDPSRIPAASGLSNFTRITAGAMGTSISTTLWEDRAAMHHAQLVEAVRYGRLPAERALEQMQAAGMSHEQALATINNLVTQQAFMLSTQEIFYASALLFAALIGLVWLARRREGAVDAGAAAGAH